MGESNFAQSLNYFVPPPLFQFLKFSEPKFIVIHWMSLHSTWLKSTFCRVLKFLQIKEGWPNFLGEPILQKVWIIWSLLLYFNFKSFLDPNFLSIIRFQCFIHDLGELFWESWSFYKLKRADFISVGNQFCRKWIIWSPFCMSILKVWWTQFLRHSLGFNAFCMINEYFLQSLQISSN